jgi:hypothetical protein
VSGFFGGDAAGIIGTWTAAIATLVVWGHLAGERRLFRWAQYLLAGTLTGYLAVLAVREVLVPRLVEPLLAAPAERVELWPAAFLVLAVVFARQLPRAVAGIPVALLVAGVAAFALSGAVVGTLLPQVVAGAAIGRSDPLTIAAGIAGAAITALVLASFVQGEPSSGPLRAMAGAGRWLVVAGMGIWLGFLLVTGLILLVDRLEFLLGDWLGLVR